MAIEILDVALRKLRELRDFGQENALGRYYSKYSGLVTNTDDPQGQGRVKVCVELLGRTDELSLWAYPTTQMAGPDYGLYFPPEKGDRVWVWFDHGDPTQPRFSGSWWRNTDPQNKTKDSSHVPTEFLNDGAPKRRGFKTPRGSAWMFSDEDDDPFFEAWTGTSNGVSAAATKNHRILMTDKSGEEKILITSKEGHAVTWNDVAGQKFVKVETAGGHELLMDDDNQVVSIKTTAGHEFVLDDAGTKVTLTTIAGNSIEVNDAQSKIELKTVAGRTLVMDDTQVVTRLQTPTGQIVEMGAAGTTVTEPLISTETVGVSKSVTAGAALTMTAGGAMALTGAGMAITSAGGGPSTMVATGLTTNTFTGLKTEALLGGLTQTVVGLWNIAATVMTIFAPSVSIGTIGPTFALVDERFLALYNAHLHITTAIGAPTGPPLVPVPGAGVTTIALRAN